jgi:carbon starvation protein
MLMEGLVGVLVVVCVGAALSTGELRTQLAAGGPIGAFSAGYGTLSAPLLGIYGQVFAVMAMNAFILTSLDSATRIGRYLTQEILGTEEKYLTTGAVVAASAALALSGQWTRLWPAFGTSNQLIAALALLVSSCWLMHRGRGYLVTLVPAGIMIVTTLAAFAYQLHAALTRLDPATGAPAPDWFIAAVVGALILLSVIVFWEGIRTLRGGPRPQTAEARA